MSALMILLPEMAAGSPCPLNEGVNRCRVSTLQSARAGRALGAGIPRGVSREPWTIGPGSAPVLVQSWPGVVFAICIRNS